MSSAGVYTDFSGLTALRTKARDDQAEARGEVARQFESIFLQMMLKTMRKAKLAESMFDGEAMQKYRDMHDQQLAVHLAGAGGIGLADVIEKQLAGGSHFGGQKNRSLDDYQNRPVYGQHLLPKKAEQKVSQASDTNNDGIEFDGSVETFVDKLKPYAEKAAAALGLQPVALLAQAALETGWGKSQMKTADGTPSFNLFGIKADTRWNGKQAAVSTLEFRDGIAQKEKANFRAYDSYQQAFDDYTKFISDNPRYQQAVRKAADPKSYFSALQHAGYATDPEYANKIMSILNGGNIHQAFGKESGNVGEES